MSDPAEPADLPMELIYMIIDELSDDMHALQALLRASRRWHILITPRAYSKWTYDGNMHSFASLWRYLRTMLQNAELAACVRVLDIRCWRQDSTLRPDSKDVVLTNDDLALIRHALQKSAVRESLREKFLTAISRLDGRPLMALLLSILPNIKLLRAVMPHSDEYLAEVLYLSIAAEASCRRDRALQNLEELDLMNLPLSGGDRKNSGMDQNFELHYLWPLLCLPRLRDVSLWNLLPGSISDETLAVLHSSPVTHLTLQYHHGSRVDKVGLFLSLPRSLVSVSLVVSHEFFASGRWTCQVLDQELWQGLQRHRGTLVHLDYYRNYFAQLSNQEESDANFTSIADFNKLNHLCIQPETVLGHCNGRPTIDLRLREVLPPSLQTLNFYGGCGVLAPEEFGEQVCELLNDESFVNIKNFRLSDMNPWPMLLDGEHGLRERKNNLRSQIESVCKEKRIRYSRSQARPLLRRDLALRRFKDP